MHLTKTQLNTCKTPFLSSRIVIKFAALISLVFMLIISTNAQTNNCPSGDPLQWDWIQSIISIANGCERNEIRQFNYEGSTYYYTAYDRTGYFCNPNVGPDYSDYFYDCNGSLICLLGFAPPCESPIINGKDNYTTIWTYTHRADCDTPVCPESNPLQWDWVQSLIDIEDCGVNKVEQFNYDGRIYIRASPDTWVNDIPCRPNPGYYYYYDCAGNRLDNREGLTIPKELCYEEIVNASRSSTTLWVKTDPWPTTIFQDYPWISNYVNHNNCDGESISVYDAGNYNFILIENGSGGKLYFENGIYYCDETPSFSCVFAYRLVNIVQTWSCGSGGENIEDICTLPLDEGACDTKSRRYYFNTESGDCDSFLYNGCGGNANNFENYFDCLNACNSIANCPEGDPLQWDWVQNYLDSRGGCIKVLNQFQYNGRTYIKAIPSNGGRVPPCKTAEVSAQYYSCTGTLVCEPGGFGFPCEEPEFYTAADNSTVLWSATYECDPYFSYIEKLDNLIDNYGGCAIGEIGQIHYRGNLYFITTPGFVENGSLCSIGNTQFYNCKGDSLCGFEGWVTLDYLKDCDPEIFSGNIQSTSIYWTYIEDPANTSTVETISVEGCPGELFKLPLVSNAGDQTVDCNFGVQDVIMISAGDETIVSNLSQSSDCYLSFTFVGAGEFNYSIPNPNDPSKTLDYTFKLKHKDDCSTPAENNTEQLEIFTWYPWLDTFVNQANCTGENITVYDAGSYNFILIQNGNEGKLYFENGTFYCNETPGYSCVDAYNLSNVAKIWSCGNSPAPPVEINGCTNADAINYNAQATTDDGSCEYENSATCHTYTGTFFYEFCAGISYYFIRLDDGRVFDPYFAEGIGITPREGQEIRFDYEIKTDVTTPCTISESPITITCFEEVENSIFDEFPWLSTLVDSNNCSGASVSSYNGGAYYFFYVQSTSGSSLYYQDGTFYCKDAPGYSCRSLYSLTNAESIWNCGGNTYFKKQNPLSLAKNGFTIYPNPASHKVFIDLPDEANCQINLIDISGKVWKQMKTTLDNTTVEMDVSDLPKGIYLLELENEQSSNIQKLSIE